MCAQGRLHPPVGTVRAPVFPLRPAERHPPSGLQRQDPHRAGLAPAPAGPPGDGLAGAAAAVLGADMGAGRRRAHRIAGLPAVGCPPCGHAQDPGGQAADPDAGKQEKPMIADHAPDVSGAGGGGPSELFVPRPELPGRGPEADPAERAAALRAEPAAHLTSRRPRLSQRTARRCHRFPEPAVVGVACRIERDRAGILQRAGCLGVGNLFGRDSRTGGRIGHAARRRKLEHWALRERRQRRCRRQAQAAKGVPPAGALAQLADQPVTGSIAGAKRAGEPVKRLRIEMAETYCMPAICTKQITYISVNC